MHDALNEQCWTEHDTICDMRWLNGNKRDEKFNSWKFDQFIPINLTTNHRHHHYSCSHEQSKYVTFFNNWNKKALMNFWRDQLKRSVNQLMPLKLLFFGYTLCPFDEQCLMNLRQTKRRPSVDQTTIFVSVCW